MSDGELLLEAIQSASLVVITALLAWVVIRLDRTLTRVSEQIKQALTIQRALQEGYERLRQRVEALEKRTDVGEY